jgi:SAM-dependent methyltransferase
MRKGKSKSRRDNESILSLELEGVSSDDGDEIKSPMKAAKAATKIRSRKGDDSAANDSVTDRQEEEKSVSIFEWYLSYKTLGDHLKKYFKRKRNALYVGCGMSALGYDLYKQAGVEEVVNVDISEEFINAMKEKYSVKKHVSFETGDAKKLRFKKGMFDLIIDKGTFDEMMCSEDFKSDTSAMLKEIFRVLDSNGVYIIISNACEELRTSFFCTEVLSWAVSDVIKIPKPLVPSDYYYVYVLSKVNMDV